VIRPFLFVTLRSFKNRVVSFLKRLRNIRYLLSFLLGMAYIWFTGFRRLFSTRFPFSQGGIPVSTQVGDVLAMIVLAMMVLVWALPEQSAGLTFSEAEIQFLFPAPITRRQLLIYKILRQQPQVLISATVMSFFALRWAKFAGLWVSFIVLSIYFTFVALARGRLKLLGIGFLIRLPVVAGVAAGLGYFLWKNMDRHGISIAARHAVPGQMPRFPELFHGPIPDVLLFVPRFFAHAVLPHSIPQFLVSAAALVAFGALLLELAARMNVAFEEASINASARWARRRARMTENRVGKAVTFPRFPPPFKIPAHARPEVAIYWKNLTAGLRISSPWLLIMLVVCLYFLGQAFYTDQQGLRMTMGMLAICMAGVFPFLGSAVFTQDMRLDLPRIELLKSYPIAGDRLVAAEIAAPLTFVAAMEIMMLTTAMVIFHAADPPEKMAFLASPQFVIIALIFATPICAAQLLIRNAVPIVLPGWAMRAPDEQKGFIALGQRLLLLGGNLLVLLFMLLPAALIVVPSLFIASRWFQGSAGLVAVATVPAAALLFFEVWLGIRFLGAQFEKLDVTNELDMVAS
jgi:putative ABC exporter